MRALLALALLATPAAADQLYICENDSSMRYRSDTREMVISRPGEMDIAIPHASMCTGGRHSGWSPFDDEDRCDKAPYALEWAPAHGDRVIEYSLEEGVVVRCRQ